MVSVLVALGSIVLSVGLAWLAPDPVVRGAFHLVAEVIIGLGAWLVIGRTRAVDLSVAASAGVGAFVGGLVASQSGWDAVFLLPLAFVAGGFVGGVAGVIAGRVGRTAGALATLALAAGMVAVGRAVPITGGRTGFHAVPLLAGDDRTDVVVAVVLAVAVAVGVTRVATSTVAARAAVAVAAPPVARVAGRRPEFDLAVFGLMAGGVLGVGGLVLASGSGSIAVDGFGLDTAATMALVAVAAEQVRHLPLGRRGRVGVVASVVSVVLLVHGPGVLFPLLPIIGTVAPLASMGPVALAVAALTAWHLARAGEPVAIADDVGNGPLLVPDAAHPGPHTPMALEAKGLAVPGGTLAVDVAAGELVGLVGPNGAGKSTVLARIGGQLPDGGGVRLDGSPAPRGAVARARAGVSRAWQRPVDVAPDDLLAVARAGGDEEAAAWAAAILGQEGDPRVRAALVAVATQRPAVVLFDEPAALVPADRVAAFLRGLADAGAAVLVVEHRREIIDVVDRIITVQRPEGSA